ncbi:MAG: cytochrome c [Gallionellaceae bacterium]
MKYLAVLVLSLAAGSVLAQPFADGNAETGSKLFVDNKCNRCHIGKVGGDGSAIFTRPDRIVNSPEQMIARFHVCSGAAGITLTPQNEQDLGAYLNKTYYKFK